jgi:hypothetical protein
MPFIPALKSPVTIDEAVKVPITVTLTTGTGSATVLGATFDPTLPLNAIEMQLSQLQYYVSGAGGAASKESGSMTAIMADQAKQLNAINTTLTQLASKALGSETNITSAANTVAQAIASLTGVITEIGVQHALQVATEVSHTQFQETATNTARKEANKPDIVAQDSDIKAKVQKNVTQIANIQGITKIAGIAGNITSTAATTAQNYLTTWLADTSIGKAVLQKIAAGKAWIKQTEIDAEAALKKNSVDANTSATTKSQNTPAPPYLG